MYFFAVMIRRPPRPTRMDTRCPDPPLFRSLGQVETFHREAQAGFAAYLAGHLDELRPIAVELAAFVCVASIAAVTHGAVRSEEHTSELQSIMRTSYAGFCFKKKKQHQ